MYWFRYDFIEKLNKYSLIEDCENNNSSFMDDIKKIFFQQSHYRLFGSYARGEANDDSDVDLYVDKGKMTSLIKYMAFVYDLENVLNCHVDVVTTGIKDKDFLDNIQSEGVVLYEE